MVEQVLVEQGSPSPQQEDANMQHASSPKKQGLSEVGGSLLHRRLMSSSSMASATTSSIHGLNQLSSSASSSSLAASSASGEAVACVGTAAGSGMSINIPPLEVDTSSRPHHEQADEPEPLFVGDLQLQQEARNNDAEPDFEVVEEEFSHIDNLDRLNTSRVSSMHEQNDHQELPPLMGSVPSRPHGSSSCADLREQERLSLLKAWESGNPGTEDFPHQANLEHNKYYYVISRRWVLDWKQWVADESVQSPKQSPKNDSKTSACSPSSPRVWTKDRPGMVRNTHLLKLPHHDEQNNNSSTSSSNNYGGLGTSICTTTSSSGVTTATFGGFGSSSSSTADWPASVPRIFSAELVGIPNRLFIDPVMNTNALPDQSSTNSSVQPMVSSGAGGLEEPVPLLEEPAPPHPFGRANNTSFAPGFLGLGVPAATTSGGGFNSTSAGTMSICPSPGSDIEMGGQTPPRTGGDPSRPEVSGACGVLSCGTGRPGGVEEPFPLFPGDTCPAAVVGRERGVVKRVVEEDACSARASPAQKNDRSPLFNDLELVVSGQENNNNGVDDSFFASRRSGAPFFNPGPREQLMVYPVKHDISDGDYMVLTEAVWRKFANLYGYDYCIKRRAVHQACSSEDSPAWEQGKHWLEYKDAHDPRDFSSSAESPRPLNAPDEDGTTTNVASTSPIGPQAQQDQGNGTCTSSSAMTIALAPNPYHGAAKLELEGAAIPVFHAVKGKTEECPGGDPQVILYESAHASADAVLRRLAAYFEVADPMAVVTSTSDKVVEVATATTFGTEVEQTQPQQTGVPTSCALPLPDESEQQLQAVASPFEERPPVPHAHQLPQPHQGESSSSTSSVLKAPTSSCKAGNDQHRSHPYKQKQNILPTTPLDSWRRRKLQFWDYFQNKKFGQAPINLSEHKSLKGHRIGPRNPILLEEADEGGEFFPKATVSSSSSSSMFSGFGRMNQHQEDVPERTDNKSNAVGSVGLNNLGNTCYMNSSLQCINSLPWLKEFFVSRQYKEFLNDQAWKSQGKIADSFSNLMKLMWEKDVIKVAPRRFKQELGQFAEQFSGYMQHDAMEFLESLIDALKEDTNTVKGRKPYFQFPDDDVRPEREILEAYLQGHRRRDNSFIDESCFQLERSRVRCPKCAKVSVTFSHNLAASLQMVSAREQKFVNMTVNVVRKNKAFWNPPMEVMTGAGGTGSSLTSSSSTCLFGGAASATTAASSSTTSNTNMMNNMNQHQVDVVQLAPCSTPFPNPAEQERSGVVAAPPASASATSSSGGETQSAFTYLTSPTSASTRSRRSEVLTSDVVLTSSSTSTSTTCPASCSSSSSSNKVGTNRPLPTQISVDVPKGSSVADLIQQIATSHSQHCGHWDLEKNILVVDVRNPRAFKYYEPRDNVDLIQKHEVLYIYEVDDRSCFSEDREVLELANGAGGQSSGPIIALPPPTGDAVVAPAVDTTSAAGASTSSSSSSSSSTTAATSTAVVSPEQGQSPEHGGDDQDKTSAAAGETPTCATSNSSPSANVSTSGDTIAGDGTSCANSQSPSPAPEVGASACGSGSGLTTTSKDAPRQGAAPSSSTSSAAATLFGTCSSSTSLEASAKNSSCQEVDCPSAQELEFHTARSETELNSISCTSSGVGGGAQPMELVGVGLEQTTAPRPVVPDEVEQEHKDSAAPTSTTSLDNNKPFTSTTSRTTSSSTFPNISSSTTSSSMPRVASSGSMPVVAGSSSSSSSLPPISLSEVPVPMEGVQLTTTTTLKRPHVDASSPSDRDDVVPPCTWLNNNNYTASSGGSAGCFPGGSNSTMSTTTGSASSTSSNGCSTSSSCASTILHNGIVMHINNNANSMGGRNFHTFQKIPPVVFSVPRNTTVGEFYKVSREKLALHIGVPQTSQLPALHIFKKEANKSNSTWGRAFTSESEVQEFLEDGSPNTALVFEDDQVPGKKYFRIAEQNVEATQLTQFDFPSPRPIGSEKRRKSELFLESLLESYMEEEQLGEDDLWRCPRCDERLPAYKKLDLYKLPPVFVIHLKRFQYTRWSRERISTPVKYPAVLNMESMVVDKSNSVPSSNCEDKADTDTNTYYLSGVVRHEGTPDGGHYIAFARNCVTGEWYEFNDSIVTPKTEEQVLSETVSAYVLFYTRGNYATWRKMKGCSNGRSGATTSACTSSSATATFTSRSSTAAPVGDTASCSTVTAHIANIDDQGSSTSQEMISSGRTSLQKSVAQMLETVRRNAEASDGDSTAASSNAERI